MSLDTRTSLSLFETDELLDELLSRYAHAIFAGMKIEGTHEDQTHSTTYETRQYSGDVRTCQGLAHSVIIRCEQAWQAREQPGSGY